MFINYDNLELNCKIVYCGAPGSGRFTNLKYVYDSLPVDKKDKFRELHTTAGGRAIFFDFPSSVELRGRRVRVHLYTHTSETFEEAVWKLLLKGLDAIVFVADSQPGRIRANVEAFDWLRRALREQGDNLDGTPFVLQYNKRDLPDALPVADINATLNLVNPSSFEATAASGVGVYDTLKGAVVGCRHIATTLSGALPPEALRG